MAILNAGQALYGKDGPQSQLGNVKFDPVNPLSSPPVNNRQAIFDNLEKLKDKEKGGVNELKRLREIEDKAKEKLEKSRDEYHKAIQDSTERSRKFYEESSPELLGPELEKLYFKEFGPRRAKPESEPKPEPKPEPEKPSDEPMS